ncbi:TetR/AcrR family transcriptional regulator [Polaromonas sp. JS666]|uniref:TetR/AcrR family transcriptional regulator n=1 Tax=Polaromonas sp. (strain JS666 / ATCC BAA-500) TaxID=296591 RepID=UPI0008835578|nr:TetR/AcrR family transcriptional regulator [Polaromonas sp. JS666]SDN04176.1 DNA-binding transcriptional regulator, AcrR family [Polaromonas sp. JS666]
MDKPAARSRTAARAPRPSQTLAAAAEKRPRGRPRKTLDERDDGNRRLELITAAARLFRKKGFDATSTRDIAAAVGMHSGSPFYHFKSKGALLHAVMEEGMRSALQRQAQALQSAALPDGDAPALLRLLVRNHFGVLLGPGSDFIPVMLYESRSITARQRAVLTKLQGDYEAVWEPVLQALARAGQLKGPVKLARLLMFGALNWSVQWFDPRQSATLDDLTDAAMALFIHAPAQGKPSKA